jgi:hypothetical protein
MTEMVTSGSMSGDEKRGDGLVGESDHERRRSQSVPPVLYATALDLDSTAHPPPSTFPQSSTIEHDIMRRECANRWLVDSCPVGSDDPVAARAPPESFARRGITAGMEPGSDAGSRRWV